MPKKITGTSFSDVNIWLLPSFLKLTILVQNKQAYKIKNDEHLSLFSDILFLYILTESKKIPIPYSSPKMRIKQTGKNESNFIRSKII